MRFRITIGVLSVLFWLAVLYVCGVWANSEGDIVPGMIVMRFAPAAMPPESSIHFQPAQVGISAVDNVLATISSATLEPLLPDRHPTPSASRDRLERTFILHFDDTEDAETVAGQLEAFTEFDKVRVVRLVGIYYFGTRLHLATDTEFTLNHQWSLHSLVDDRQDIDGPEAWEIEQGNPAVIIGIIDSGTPVDTTFGEPWILNTDFNYYYNAAEDSASPGALDYGDVGATDSPADPDSVNDNIIGYNFNTPPRFGPEFKRDVWRSVPMNAALANPGNAADPWKISLYFSHGLNVASVAASRETPAGGFASVCGVAPQCKVYHVRLDASPDGVDPSIGAGNPITNARAILHAAQHCDVINMSWGYFSLLPEEIEELQDAVQTASEPAAQGGYDCVLVAAVGNVSKVPAGQPMEVAFPARFPEVLGVGNMTGSLHLYHDSIFGPTIGLVSVVAPVDSGVPVESNTQCIDGDEIGGFPCHISESIVLFNGTSAASPHVAGVAALVRSRFPGLSQQQVKDRITNSAEWYWGEPRSDLDRKKYGNGKINAYRAITEWGTIATNTTWTVSGTRDGKYYISGDLTIATGATLTINPGVIVKVAPDHLQGAPDAARVKITVKSAGTLNIAGTLASPVTFESFTDSPSGNYDWAGITFEVGSNGSISHAIFNNAGVAIVNHAAIDVDDVLIQDGITGIDSNANLNLTNSTLQNLAGTAILARSGNLTLDTVTIQECGGNAIASGGTTGVVSITNCDIDDIDGHGVSFTHAASSLTIGETTVDHAATAFHLASQTSTLIYNCALRSSDIGIALYGVAGVDILDSVLDDLATTGVYAVASTAVALDADTVSNCVVGVFFDLGTGGTIDGNCKITYNSVGVKFDNNATGTVRHTRIASNNNGVAVLNGANPDLGVASSGTGCGGSGSNLGFNSIYSSTQYHVVNAVSGSTISAEGNWWNAYPPKSSKFYGSVDRDPYLCGDPNPVAPFASDRGREDDPRASVPTQFALGPCYPNPFNPSTRISFDVPTPGGRVEIAIFDVGGAKVRTLVDGHHAAGTHSATWTGQQRLR